MIRVATIGTSSITRRTVAAAAGVQGLLFTTAYSRDAATAAALASELHLMAGWLGLTDVAVLDRGTLAAELRNHA